MQPGYTSFSFFNLFFCGEQNTRNPSITNHSLSRWWQYPDCFTLHFVGYRLTYDVDIITHLRYYYQRFFCSLWGNQTPALISVLLSAIHYTKRPIWCLSISHPYYLVRVEHPCSQCRIWTYIFNKGLYWKTYTVFIEWCRPTVASTNSANWPIWGWELLVLCKYE